MYAIFCDLSPKLKPYGNVFRQLSERGVFAPAALSDRLIMKARYVLENELLIGAERVDYFLGVLNILYGEAETPRPIPLPVVKPSPPPAEIVKRGKCGGNITYALDKNGVLTISGKGAMFDFDVWYVEWNLRTDAPWWNTHETISHVEIQDDVTTIGDGAFLDCAGLISVTIPHSVTSIGDDAFLGCTGLTSVIIPNSVSTIGEGSFSDCTGLTSVSLPAKAEIVDSAFPDTVRIERRA